MADERAGVADRIALPDRAATSVRDRRSPRSAGRCACEVSGWREKTIG